MKQTILVVDDDPQIRDALSKALNGEGYEVRSAGDGPEALAHFEPGRIHMVLLDLNLPATSGWDIFERLTSIDPLIPVIIVTGRNNEYPTAAAAGAGALMEKPLDVPLLLQTIRSLLAEPPEARLKRLVGLQGMLRYSGRNHPPSLGPRGAEI